MIKIINRIVSSCNGLIVIKVLLASLVCVLTMVPVASMIVNKIGIYLA